MQIPKYPYPLGQVMSKPPDSHSNHSGCHGGVDHTNVKRWQQRMREQGWLLIVDGCFGPQTEKVCRNFQVSRGLQVDGKVGPKTWREAWLAPHHHGSWRDTVAGWHEAHIGITEQPPGSNCDTRRDGIRAAQDGCADGTWLRNQPWCGIWAWAALHAAKITKRGDSFMASVASIEDFARAKKAPFRGWTLDGDQVKKGDLVVMFGRGIHVETVRAIDELHVYTWGGNTSSNNGGSQSNGGGAFKRTRLRSQVHGYALVRGE